MDAYNLRCRASDVTQAPRRLSRRHSLPSYARIVANGVISEDLVTYYVTKSSTAIYDAALFNVKTTCVTNDDGSYRGASRHSVTRYEYVNCDCKYDRDISSQNLQFLKNFSSGASTIVPLIGMAAARTATAAATATATSTAAAADPVVKALTISDAKVDAAAAAAVVRASFGVSFTTADFVHAVTAAAIAAFTAVLFAAAAASDCVCGLCNSVRHLERLCVIVAIFSFCAMNGVHGNVYYASEGYMFKIGDVAEPSCFVGDPTATIFWFRNGKRLVNVPQKYEIIEQPTFSTLVINNTVEADMGSGYECQSSTDGTFQNPDVLAGAIAKDSPTQTVAIGSTITVTCDGFGYPAPTATWSFNGKPVVIDGVRITTQSYTRQISGEVIKDGILQINNAQPSDAGTYECSLKNRYQTEIGKTNVIIPTSSTIAQSSTPSTLPPPVLTTTNDTVEGEYRNQTATLFCSSPDPTDKFKWFFQGVQLNETASKYDIDTPIKNALVVYNVGPRSVGRYVCQSVKTNATASAYIFATPSIKESPTKTLYVGNTLIQDCNGWGYPVPNVTWYGDGIPLVADGQHIQLLDQTMTNGNQTLKGGRLQINNLQVSDYKTYTCSLTDSVGGSSLDVLVRVHDSAARSLWPFLGIIGEAALMTGGIVWYERALRRTRRERDERERAFMKWSTTQYRPAHEVRLRRW